MPALSSGRYHIKWTQLASLPIPLYDAYVAVQHHKIYVTGFNSPVEGAKHQVYVYNTNTNLWGQLPLSGHYYGIPQFIGGKLVIIGGCSSATKRMTNKVSTFAENSQTWTSYYPDLLSVRSKPGVVSHLEYVIVARGAKPKPRDNSTAVVQDDIEIPNWMENLQWKKICIKLPTPMYGFTPTISDDHLLIVGYCGAGNYKSAYEIPVANIIASIDQQCNSDTCKWTEVTAADHWFTSLVPNSSPPVIAGGRNKIGTVTTGDIMMYKRIEKMWDKVGILSSTRSVIAIASVSYNGIIVIGGYVKGSTAAITSSSSVTVVELGQAELLQ